MTDKLRAAAKVARTMLHVFSTYHDRLTEGDIENAKDALADLDEALAEPPNFATDVVKPIGEIQVEQMGANAMRAIVHFYNEPPPVGTKLYAALPDVRKNRITEWQGLTDGERSNAWAQTKGDVLMRLVPFARFIEAKLREKNHG